MCYSLAACCSVLPRGISLLCSGVEEEGLIYSKLCNHLGKCWPGADCSIAAAPQLSSQQHTGLPESKCKQRGFPLFLFFHLHMSPNLSLSLPSVCGISVRKEVGKKSALQAADRGTFKVGRKEPVDHAAQ